MYSIIKFAMTLILFKKSRLNHDFTVTLFIFFIRQEIDLANTFSEPAVDFKTRTDFDLRRVVEDQV